MKEVERLEGGVIVAFSDDELSMIISSMGETLEALEDWEFETRTGFQREEIRQLLDQALALARRKK